jgi:hypothetical protein
MFMHLLFKGLPKHILPHPASTSTDSAVVASTTSSTAVKRGGDAAAVKHALLVIGEPSCRYCHTSEQHLELHVLGCFSCEAR